LLTLSDLERPPRYAYRRIGNYYVGYNCVVIELKAVTYAKQVLSRKPCKIKHVYSTDHLYVKVKVSGFIYRSFCSTGVSRTQGAQAWITLFYLQLHQCLPLPRKRSPDGASTDWCGGHLTAAMQPTTHLSTSKGWKAESAWLVDL